MLRDRKHDFGDAVPARLGREPGDERPVQQAPNRRHQHDEPDPEGGEGRMDWPIERRRRRTVP